MYIDICHLAHSHHTTNHINVLLMHILKEYIVFPLYCKRTSCENIILMDLTNTYVGINKKYKYNNGLTQTYTSYCGI